MVTMGPLEFVIIRFPSNEFTGAIIPELRKIVDKDLIHIIDLTFIAKDAMGKVQAYELADISREALDAWQPVVANVRSILSQPDIEEVGEMMDPNTSAAILVFEHLWALGFRQAVQNAGGELLGQGQIPPRTSRQPWLSSTL